MMTNKSSFFGSRTSPLKWALLISVLVNLLLLGVLTGAVSDLKPHKHFALMALATSHSEKMLKRMEHSLDPTDAAAFHESIRPQAAALQQSHDQVLHAIKDVATLYQQDPPDPTALQTAIDHLNQARASLNDVVGKILQDSYAKLSPDGRHRLAELSR